MDINLLLDAPKTSSITLILHNPYFNNKTQPIITQNHLQTTHTSNSTMDHRFQLTPSHRLVFVAFIIITLWVEVVTGLDLNLENTQILASADQYRIKLKPQQGQPPYTLMYTRLPGGWTVSEKYLFVPKSQSNVYNQDLISVVLRDGQLQEYRTSLIFIHNREHIMMDTTCYPYDVLNEQIGLLSFNSTASRDPLTFKDKLQKKIQSILSQAHMEAAKSVGQNLDTVLTSLPDMNTLKEAFATNNIFALVKTIGAVSNSQINCLQQVAYLSQMSVIGYQTMKAKQVDTETYSKDLLNKLISEVVNPTAIPQSNQTTSKNVSLSGPAAAGDSPVSRTAQNNSAFASQQQNNKTISQLQYSVSNLKNQFYLALEQLKAAYSRLNLLTSNFNALNSKVLISNIDIDKNKQQLNRLLKNRQAMNAKSYISNLTDAEKRGLVSQNQVLLSSIKQTTSSIQSIKQSIQLQERSVSQVSSMIDMQKLLVLNLETNLTSIQSQISSINKQLLALYEPLSPLSTVDPTAMFFVLQTNPQLLYMNLKTASQLSQYNENLMYINDLERIMEYITFNLNNAYHSCYGLPKSNATQPTTNSNSSVATSLSESAYVIPYSSFVSYFQKLYMSSSSASSNRFIMGDSSVETKPVQLSTVNILSSIWTKRFGDALPYISNSGGSNRRGCSYIDGLEPNSGMIIQVSHNIVQVGTENGQILYVLLGACTRIEMSGMVTPDRGRLIFWRGRRLQNYGNAKDVFDSHYVLIL